MSSGSVVQEVLQERMRQKTSPVHGGEGWDDEHDDGYDRAQLADAACCYIADAANKVAGIPLDDEIAPMWPWDKKWWKPGAVRRNLIKACALLIAEIERLDREKERMEAMAVRRLS